MPHRSAFALALLVLGMSTGASRADSVFGDLSGFTANGYNVGGAGNNNAIAEGFTMTTSATVTSITLILQNYTAGTSTGSFDVSLFANIGSSPSTDQPNTSIDLGDFSGAANSVGPTPGAVTFTGSAALAAGVTYWLDFYATNFAGNAPTVEWTGSVTSGGGQLNPSGPDATDVGQLRSTNGNSFSGSGLPSTSDRRTGFELDGSVVPEPSSFVLIAVGSAVGLLGAFGNLHRRVA